MPVLRHGVHTQGLTGAARRRPLVIWRFSDGRRGHDAQSRGLAAAICRIQTSDCHDFPVAGPLWSLVNFLRAHFPAGADRPDPDLLIGAGHATHLPLLAARRARGGRAVILMSPSIPAGCFDLCLVPEHDEPAPGGNIIVTQGPLNTVAFSQTHVADRGLILIGGPSRHFHWHKDGLAAQITAIVAHADTKWCIGDSPRTPPSTRHALRALARAGIEYAAYEEVGTDWLGGRLATTGSVWVTPDSLSMIYEALSSGAGVGVLTLPIRRVGRVSRGIENLARRGMITTYAQWSAGTALAPRDRPLREADRCAQLVLQRLDSSASCV